MDLARVSTPLRVVLRSAFAAVVVAASVVDLWLARELTLDGSRSLPRAAIVIAVAAWLGIAWAVWPRGVLVVATAAAVWGTFVTAQPATRGPAIGVGVFTQFVVMPVLFGAVLASTSRWRWPVAALVLVGAGSVAMRADDSRLRAIIAMAMLVLLGAAVSAVVYIHLRDSERRTSIEHARQNERLELARELHDMVGHHVTGIVVMAQASRFTSGAEAGSAADVALADIEAAGIETLTSLRRLVGLLRTDPSTAAGPTLADLQRIVDDLRTSHPASELVVDDQVRTHWVPPDLAITVQRLVQEAATNVRRHGDPTGPVTFTLTAPDGDVDLLVENRVLRATIGTGYGLVGMRERADALGGTFRSGPDGNTWRVHVRLPALRRAP